MDPVPRWREMGRPVEDSVAGPQNQTAPPRGPPPTRVCWEHLPVIARLLMFWAASLT